MHSTQLLVMGIAAVGCTIALVACGGSANYSAAGTTNPSANSALELSQCMHSHGIKNFPDPTNSAGGGPGLSLSTTPGTGTVNADGITFSGPAFEAAAKACAKLLPGGGGPAPAPTAQQKRRALEFAQCMRKHGVPDFPDPTFPTGSGAAGKASSLPADVNPSSPAFKQAVSSCGGASTRSDEIQVPG
jgi:hypothetical protein